MTKPALILGFILIFLPLDWPWAQDKAEIKLDSHRLIVNLAVDVLARTRGLSGVGFLGPDQGMLFVYPQKKMRRFWMAGTKMALDVIWIRDGVVIGLEPNLPPPLPGQSPVVVASPQPVDMVLEVGAGWAARHGIEIGAVLEAAELPTARD